MSQIKIRDIGTRPGNTMQRIQLALSNRLPPSAHLPTVGRALDMAYFEGVQDALAALGYTLEHDEDYRALKEKSIP